MVTVVLLLEFLIRMRQQVGKQIKVDRKEAQMYTTDSSFLKKTLNSQELDKSLKNKVKKCLLG